MGADFESTGGLGCKRADCSSAMHFHARQRCPGCQPIRVVNRAAGMPRGNRACNFHLGKAQELMCWEAFCTVASADYASLCAARAHQWCTSECHWSMLALQSCIHLC